MKKIYTVTLSEGDIPSANIASDMRIIGYFLCSNLDGFETKDGRPIMYSDGVKPNELLEVNFDGGVYYHFTSDNPKIDNKLLYEPFIVDDRSFGFTVIDDEIVSYDSIVKEISKVLLSLEKNDGFIHYNFTVDETFFDEAYEDRETVIKHLVLNGGEINSKANTKKRVLSKLPLIGILGR